MILSGSFAKLQRSLPGLRCLAVGGVDVAWLERSVALSEAEIEARLHPEERAYAATLRAPARRAEYRRARWLLRSLSAYDGPLPRDPSGMPSWPPGHIGSLTHKDGAVGVALAAEGSLAALGIDAEDVARVKTAFEAKILRESESRLLDALVARAGGTREHWLAVAFSFKEAIFKCHYPLGRTMFWFHDAVLEQVDAPGAGAGTLAARLLRQTSPVTPENHVVRGAFIAHAADERAFVVTVATEP